jgi:hypothetical protein
LEFEAIVLLVVGAFFIPIIRKVSKIKTELKIILPVLGKDLNLRFFLFKYTISPAPDRKIKNEYLKIIARAIRLITILKTLV